MSAQNRPLSPHLDVYRLPLTAIISICHRITGVGLSVGTVLLAYWLMAAASGPESFASINSLLGSWFGKILLFLWTFAFYFHFCHGIRHLFWDAGKGFEQSEGERLAMIELIATVMLTIVTVAIAFIGGGS
ncbi:MAG: succinate dehydrogenase, cytochrome b556 subunit [Gammaproteobacteria bacterium]